MFIDLNSLLLIKILYIIKTIIIYYHSIKTDILSQINLSFNNGIYTFSFPIDDIHYSTTFTDKKNLMKYMNFIVHSHKF